MNPIKAVVDLILPRICHVCGDKLIEGEKFICMQCKENLPRTLYHRYWNTPVSASSPNAAMNPMEAKFAGQIPFVHAIATFFYSKDSSLSRLVHDFKYRNFPSLAYEMGKTATEEIYHSGFFSGIDCILPIPLHWLKRYRRGYNQTLFLAKGVSEVTGIPVFPNLKARRGHRTQTSLSPEQRRKNILGIFQVDDPSQLEGLDILLIDDICTTGSTLTAAAEKIIESTSSCRLHIMTLGVTE